MRLLGVDVGGTFTDLALVDLDSQELWTHKLLTTPEEPERAVMDGVRFLVQRAGGRAPARIVHGTTLITNAIVERKGAVTALLTTRGFRDVLEIRREGRYDLYDLDLEFPEPLVPRSRRFEAGERINEVGRVVQPLDEEALAGLLEHVPQDIASWAVCFLHAYANPAHERRAGELLREAFPRVPVSLASDVAPEIREYERTSTVVANAYVRPTAETYLKKLAAELGQRGEAAALHIMLSDGGLIPPETAARHPIRIVESGPAGGVLAAERLRKRLDLPAVLSLDMGGTTAKIAFLDSSGPRTRSLFEVDRRHLFKRGSGLPVLVPSLDLVEIGAGGGSLARRGPLGTLVVGPESAGALPGPACYGRGGHHPTVTDADLVLGLLDPDYFLGGTMRLDAEHATGAIEEHVARPLGLDIMNAAAGIRRIVGSNMAEAARMHAAERGLDLTAHTLVAFGGAGPVHAWSLARQLRIPRLIFPAHSGVASSVGFLAAPPAFETARSFTQPLDQLRASEVERVLEELAETARKELAGTGRSEVATRASVDMRYRGQGAEVRVPLPGLRVNRDELAGAFATAYAALYGRPVVGVPVEVVTWRVRAERSAPELAIFDTARVPEKGVSSPKPSGYRTAWLPDFDAPRKVPVFRRESLSPGMEIEGPALIEDRDTTLVLGAGKAIVLVGGAVLAEVAAKP